MDVYIIVNNFFRGKSKYGHKYTDLTCFDKFIGKTNRR